MRRAAGSEVVIAFRKRGVPAVVNGSDRRDVHSQPQNKLGRAAREKGFRGGGST